MPDNKSDIVFDRAPFCAPHPFIRSDYLKVVNNSLKNNGLLLAILFGKNRDDI